MPASQMLNSADLEASKAWPSPLPSDPPCATAGLRVEDALTKLVTDVDVINQALHQMIRDQLPGALPPNHGVVMSGTGTWGTILDRQRILWSKTTWLNFVTVSRTPMGNKSRHTNPEVSTLIYFLEHLNRGEWTAKADERRARELVSVFDVDGPCTVATPFVPEWEVLPRPEIRGMSTCWVVRPVRPGDGRSEGEIEGEGIQNEVEEELKYEIQYKTRGLWQLTELRPTQDFVFI